MGAVIFLALPLAVAAESRLGEDGQRAAAHLMFKIVIPQTLSLDIGQTLQIGGSVPGVLSLPARATEDERHQVFLSTTGRRSIAQFAACSRAGTRATPTLHCTVSMP
jgi:hypothetical protein